MTGRRCIKTAQRKGTSRVAARGGRSVPACVRASERASVASILLKINIPLPARICPAFVPVHRGRATFDVPLFYALVFYTRSLARSFAVLFSPVPPAGRLFFLIIPARSRRRRPRYFLCRASIKIQLTGLIDSSGGALVPITRFSGNGRAPAGSERETPRRSGIFAFLRRTTARRGDD